ncbi:uncharacterized protein LOC143278020 [Babylonia areolata]|uniref:uncharacterized protein LOC143278020 n=1 Tax=Babylonia areolata TaxID=304850 RepID=UPI003FD39DBF
MEQKISKIESEIDKLEEYSRRENLRFFGIPPLGQNENNDTCVSAVVDTLNSVERGVKKWTPDDIVRAHRIGQTREGNPRPMIVRFARWRDKMTIITDRDLRNKLTEKGVKVANDLTRAQSSVVAQARREGKKAYFRKGKLVIAPLPPDPRTYAEAASVGVADCSPVAHSTAAGTRGCTNSESQGRRDSTNHSEGSLPGDVTDVTAGDRYRHGLADRTTPRRDDSGVPQRQGQGQQQRGTKRTPRDVTQHSGSARAATTGPAASRQGGLHGYFKNQPSKSPAGVSDSGRTLRDRKK